VARNGGYSHGRARTQHREFQHRIRRRRQSGPSIRCGI
jgi:hypothetical protein